jgi:hypothetical protein
MTVINSFVGDYEWLESPSSDRTPRTEERSGITSQWPASRGGRLQRTGVAVRIVDMWRGRCSAQSVSPSQLESLMQQFGAPADCVPHGGA